jgi:hypothetical protein
VAQEGFALFVKSMLCRFPRLSDEPLNAFVGQIQWR